jgi:hypothetical protein
MNKEYEIRREKAEEIKNLIGDLTEGLIIVGSVAYNPEAVTASSDLDLVAILDFSNINFKEFYSRINQAYEPKLVEYASKGKIDIVSIVWDTRGFEVGLHLWDKNAFDTIINLGDYNLIFKRKDFDRDFLSTAEVANLRNLKGEEKTVYKDPKEVDGGTILKLFIHVKDNSDFYPSIQIFNLLLDPKPLNENLKLSNKIEQFEKNLRNILIKIYNSSSKSINLYNALSDKLKGKLTKDLENRLRTFF